MMLHPPKPTPTCDHPVLVFGCDACILRERVATLDEAKRTTPAPACPDCKEKMVLYDSDIRTMTLYFVCNTREGSDDDYGPACAGEVEVKVR